MTQFQINRSQAATIDWEAADLKAMVVAAIRAPEAVTVAVTPEVEASPAWQQVRAEAQAQVGPRDP